MLDLELHIHFKCKHYRSFFPIIFQLDFKIHYQFLRNHFVPELSFVRLIINLETNNHLRFACRFLELKCN